MEVVKSFLSDHFLLIFFSSVLAFLLLSLFVMLLVVKINKRNKHTRNVEIAKEMVKLNVVSIYQDRVETMKKEGSFDEKAQKAILGMVLSNLQQSITKKVEKSIKKVYGDFFQWLTMEIETQVAINTPHVALVRRVSGVR